MKALLIGASALALAGAAQANDWYASIGTGANIGGIDQSFAPFPASLDAQTGFVFTGAVGTHITGVPGLRLEGEIGYRSNDIDLRFGPFQTGLTDETFSVMAKGYYDFKVNEVTLYPFAGIGVADRNVSLDILPLSALELGNTGFAYALGAGASYPIVDGLSIAAEYEFFDGPDFDFGPVHDEGHNHSVRLKLTVAL